MWKGILSPLCPPPEAERPTRLQHVCLRSHREESRADPTCPLTVKVESSVARLPAPWFPLWDCML